MLRLLFVFIFSISRIIAQDSTEIKRIITFQEKLNKKFSIEDTSPLLPNDLKKFKSLDFFEIDTTFIVKAKFVRTPYETPFIMKTTTGNEPLYVKYGEAHFTLDEKSYILNIYQNQGLKTNPEYQNYLFLPFTDLTNGFSTYKGGRYIDLVIPENELILIDFNTAYNPFCSYNESYSCPIPPKENDLDLKIPVGVKVFKKKQENE